MVPNLTDLLDSARVVTLPLRTRFRGITVREAMILEGPNGFTEFSPFVEYDDAEAAAWLGAAIDFGWGSLPALHRDSIRVNATMPAVTPGEVSAILARYPGCRTVKIKVADPGHTLADDVARVREVRAQLGPEGRVRIDANGLWTLDEAERAIHALAEFDLEYVEQPCASVDELAQLRDRISYLDVAVAADESVRKASDPLAVARAGAADLLVIKAQPLGGITAALAICSEAGLPVVVSSALDTSIGISMGLHLAAALPELDYDCGLATVALLAEDVTADSLVPDGGAIAVRRVDASAELMQRHAASADRTDWWMQRLARTHEVLRRRVEEERDL